MPERALRSREKGTSLPVVHECGVEERPCPRVECRHHLACGERPGPFAQRADASETCSLDVAGRGPATLREVAGLMGVDPSRVLTIEVQALAKAGRLLVLGGAAPEGVRDWPALLERLRLTNREGLNG